MSGARRPVPIVGIGASAGGLEALEQFFSRMTPDSGFAFVVIQHLAPHHSSILAQLLGRSTPMPVAQVHDGARAEPNHVYVIAPGTMLGIADGSFQVRPTDGDRHEPIDAFFRTLADDLGGHAVGIVLSGSGTDGTRGLRAIQDAGGLVLVQSPGTAAHANMPRSAIESGVAHDVLPAGEMPARLLAHAAAVADRRAAPPRAAAAAVASPPGAAVSDHDLVPQLERICELVQRATGHDFSHYKRGTVLRRVARRVQQRQASSPDGYVELLATDPQEAGLLAKELLVGVTQFFRDPDAFDYLTQHVLPGIFAAKNPDESLRIWVAGCASGEEAYSLCMLVREQLDHRKDTRPVQIFGTDIDADAIAEARGARYPVEIAEAVSPARLARFFVREGASYRIAREIRDMCIFSEHSLIREPPFLAIDLLSCRNVLIYLDAELQKRLVPVFHYALHPGGFLFLGSSEGLAGHAELFEVVEKRFRVFRRLEPAIRPTVEFPLASRPAPRATQPQRVVVPGPPSNDQVISTAFERLVLQDYAPAGAVVNAQGEIICIVGPTGRYLQPQAGVLTRNILEIAHASLRIELRTALHAAARSGRKVVKDNVFAEINDVPCRLRITVRPLPGIKADGLFAVVLQEPAIATETAEAGEPPLASESASQVEQLESELRTTRNQLRSTIEELESANEELKSSNEEMLSTNEEMQSSNEELQSSQEELRSVNEELATVNAELARKLDELGRANSDLQNLFGSTDIATLFLDRELRLARFTPAARTLFRLIDADIGRPLSDLAPRLVDVDLGAAVAGVLNTLQPIERPVETADPEAWFLLRVLPYRTVEQVVSGAVITLTDITQVKRSEVERERLVGELREARDQLTAELNGTSRLLEIGALFLHEGNLASVLGEIVDAAIAICGADFGDIQALDRASGEQTFVAHRGLPAWWIEHWKTAPGSQGAYAAARQRRARAVVEDVERDPLFAGTPALEIARRAGVRAAQSLPLVSRSGELVGILSTHHRAPGAPDPRALRLLDLVARQTADILERARAERALKDSEERLRTLVEVSSEVLYRVSPDWSEIRELKSRGLLAPAVAGRSWLQTCIPPEDRRDVQAVIDRSIATRNVFELEHRVVRADGSSGWMWSRAVPLRDASGVIAEWFGAATDVTARKRVELELAEVNRRLLEADRRKNEFISVLSHELRNPLAPIGNSLDLLDHIDLGDDLARRARDVIRRQFDHLTRMVGDLLDITRITSAKVTLQREGLDLDELVRRTVEDHRAGFVRAGIELGFAAPPVAVRVSGDPTRLAQVISNLLQNAVKFTPRGRRTTVSVERDPARGDAVVRVTDTGRGIPADILPRLFERFTQADTTLDRQRGGLGLGLSIAKALVDLHGGSISAVSDGPGLGASFTVTLPLDTSAPAPPADRPHRDTAGQTPRHRVLVIDDNVDAAAALRDALALAGHQIEIAYNGPDGLQRMRTFRPDVVLCDIGLPVVDGYQVARTVRADPDLGRTPLVAVTGYGAPDDLAKAQAAGFDLHLTKPVGAQRLEEILRELAAVRPARP